MPTILHFADAHIDMANYGRHDAASGLPVRVMDFLKSLDTIVDTAISERVDLVLFAGDAYKDRNPSPTFQREWGKRVMRLSRAGIPTLLLVGNHDLSPSYGRAHTLETFDTLQVPSIQVLGQPAFLGPDKLAGLPLQVIALPWVNRSGMLARMSTDGGPVEQVYEKLEEFLTEFVHGCLEQADPSLPTILTAHCSVQGASYGGERTVMLGSDLVLPASLVRDPRLDYVALGHIHKPQNLNPHAHPPVIYPGSIERVDFGEARDDKFFVIAHVDRGKTQVVWRKLEGIRPFFDRHLKLDHPEDLTNQLRAVLPDPQGLVGAVVRLVVEYPREWDSQIDEAALREYTAECLEFRLVKKPQVESRIRLPQDQHVGSLTPLELIDLYLRANHTDQEESAALKKLAELILQNSRGD